MPPLPDAAVSVQCEDLSIARGRGGARVVDGATFTVPRGGALAVMGPAGAGKSSLAAVLAGAETDAVVVGGSAHIEGIDVRARGRRRRVLTYVTGWLAQGAGAALPARLTVSDIIGQPITGRDRRVNRRALAIRVAGLLDELQLPLGTATKFPYELSAGMRQRVALARSLVLEPRLFVGDDPFANLDLEVRSTVRQALQRRQREMGMSLLLVTNEQDVIRRVGAEVLVLRRGYTVGYGHGLDDMLWTPGEDARIAP